MAHVIIWRDLEDIVFSEINQFEFSGEVPKFIAIENMVGRGCKIKKC